MDAASITSSLLGLSDDIHAIEKSIPIAITKTSFGRSWGKKLEALGQEVRIFKETVGTVTQTVEANPQIVARFSPTHGAGIEECISRLPAKINILAVHTQNLAAGLPGHEMFASLPGSLRRQEEVGAVEIYRDRVLTYQKELGVILCLLNLGRELEQKAPASTIGPLLAALQRHMLVLDADIKAMEKVQRISYSTGPSRALSTTAKSVSAMVMAADVDAPRMGRSHGRRRISTMFQDLLYK